MRMNWEDERINQTPVGNLKTLNVKNIDSVLFRILLEKKKMKVRRFYRSTLKLNKLLTFQGFAMNELQEA